MGEVLKFAPRTKSTVAKILAQADEPSPSETASRWNGAPNAAGKGAFKPNLASNLAQEWPHELSHFLSAELDRAYDVTDKFSADLKIVMSQDEEAALGRMDIYGHTSKEPKDLVNVMPFIRIQANHVGEDPPMLSGTRTEICGRKFMAYMDDWIALQGPDAEAPVHAMLPGLIWQLMSTRWYSMVVGYTLPPNGSNGRARIVVQDLQQKTEWSFTFDMALANQEQV